MERYVLDASAFMNVDMLNYSKDDELFTVEEIEMEAKDFKSRALFALSNVKISEPDKKYVKTVEEEAKKSGDIHVLSKADIKVIALALEMDAIVVSDDFDVQNLCSILNIDYKNVSGKKISYEFKRELFCEKCGKKGVGKFCDNCGNNLIVKVVATKRI